MLSRSGKRSTIYCTIPGEKKIGPVIEIKIVGTLGIHGIDVSVPSTRDPTQTCWVLISRGKNRFVNQMEDPDVSHNVPSSNLLREQANSKGEDNSDDDDRDFRRPVSTFDPSSSSKLEKNLVVLVKIIPRKPQYEGWSLSAQNSRLPSKMVRNFDQDGRQADGAVHWNALEAVLTRGFKDRGAETFTDYQWWNFSRRKQQSEIRVLRNFSERFGIRSCDSGTLQEEKQWLVT